MTIENQLFTATLLLISRQLIIGKDILPSAGLIG